MSSQPLFYKNIVPLNKEVHGDWSVEAVSNYKHTSDTNSLYIAAIEFVKAANEYPIVFGIGSDDAVFPVVLLGLRKNENLYVNKKGEWLANYVPAYVRRYPFILATGDEASDNFTVCIDDDCPGFNKKGKGTKLFDKDGNESELLNNSVEFLKEYQNHIQLTTLFCNNIKELGLLEPMKADVKLADGEEITLGGFMGVNREKLKALDSEKLVNLIKTDQMELIYAHLISLGNINSLMAKLKS
ncbi:MAG: SapC family protein [Proteobacteria bacterium]|nr:SapC family protein [Pseudomonadota bacterium]